MFIFTFPILNIILYFMNIAERDQFWLQQFALMSEDILACYNLEIRDEKNYRTIYGTKCSPL